MAEQVGPRESEPDRRYALRGREGVEVFPGKFHQGQQTTVCSNRPDIRLQPILNRQKSNIACQNGRRPYKRRAP